MLGTFRPKNSRGDTIIEVMIVLAVLGFAISIAYATANRSLLNARQAQENSEASRYVQSQIEGLISLAPSGTTIYSQTSGFCIPDAKSPTIKIAAPLSPCTFGTIPYTVLIYNCDRSGSSLCSAPNVASNSDSFVVQASWDDVIGQGTDYVTQVYRVHPPQ